MRVPLLENVEFEIRPYSMFNAPKWYADGIHLLEELAHTAIEREFMLAKRLERRILSCNSGLSAAPCCFSKCGLPQVPADCSGILHILCDTPER